MRTESREDAIRRPSSGSSSIARGAPTFPRTFPFARTRAGVRRATSRPSPIRGITVLALRHFATRLSPTPVWKIRTIASRRRPSPFDSASPTSSPRVRTLDRSAASAKAGTQQRGSRSAFPSMRGDDPPSTLRMPRSHRLDSPYESEPGSRRSARRRPFPTRRARPFPHGWKKWGQALEGAPAPGGMRRRGVHEATAGSSRRGERVKTGTRPSLRIAPAAVRSRSGRLRGDQQLGATIAQERIPALVLFRDPVEPHPRGADVKALRRIAVVCNVPIACNRSTADSLISSPLTARAGSPQIEDRSTCIGRPVTDEVGGDRGQSL